jgi:hypothetical protein
MNSSDQNYTLDLTPQDYQKAYVEVAFLLDAFASTIDNIMGGNTTPVGRIAGGTPRASSRWSSQIRRCRR